MTPVEISEYKMKWKPGNTVRLHSDLRSRAKDFCKDNLEKHQWDMTKYTNVYEDTFMFESTRDARAFKSIFQEYADL